MPSTADVRATSHQPADVNVEEAIEKLRGLN